MFSCNGWGWLLVHTPVCAWDNQTHEMDTTLSTAWLIINVHLVSVFWHCISVFANFSYGIALLGTPQFPPLYNLDNLWLISSMLHRVIKLPPVKWVRMSLEEYLINMVSSLNIQFSKPVGTGGTHVRYAKYEILSFMVDFSDWWRVALGLLPTFSQWTLSSSYWTIVLEVKLLTATKGLHISFTSSLTKIQWN